jgi:hypothetical protein
MSPIVISTTRWNSPGHGVINGDWDLRDGVDAYLGHVTFAAQRVLEIGLASGFLTCEMEKRGAEVVSVEATDDHGWDFVPYPPSKLDEVFGPRQIVMRRLKDSYWFNHAAHHSKAQIYYGDIYQLRPILDNSISPLLDLFCCTATVLSRSWSNARQEPTLSSSSICSIQS